MTYSRNDILARAAIQGVVCGGCGKEAKPTKLLGIITRPQWQGTTPFALVEFQCETADCGTAIPLEIDL